MDFKNKANNNALGQTPTSLHERAEGISGITKGHHFEISITPM